MRESSDNLLDRDIAAALRRGTAVTRQQQELAWEHLRRRAAQQTMLPATRQPAHEPLSSWLRRGLLACASLLFDDTRYDRAMRRRQTCQPCAMMEVPLRGLLGGMAT